MINNKPLIDRVIEIRGLKKDVPRYFAVRNKASPINSFSPFIPYSREEYEKCFKLLIDGLKIKFKYTTIYFNGRHKSK